MPSTERPNRSSPPSDHPVIELAVPSEKTGRFGKFDTEVVEAGWPELRPQLHRDPDRPTPTPTSPGKGTRVARRRRLHGVASLQHGLFTLEQASTTGHDRRTRYHHLDYGNWRRTEAPDVYRLSGWCHDDNERLRAWLMWAGPDASLTSWTALELHGLVVVGPRAKVELIVPPPSARTERRRRERLKSQLTVLDGRAASDQTNAKTPLTLPSSTWVGSPAGIHTKVPRPPVLIDDMRVSRAEEALCVAARSSDGKGSNAVALALIGALLDAQSVDLQSLADCAIAMGCVPVTELIFDRRRSPRVA